MTGGFKVFPAEIERVVPPIPPSRWSRRSQPDELKGEIAKAYVVLKPGAGADAAELIVLCRQELAAYKVPRAVQFVPDCRKHPPGRYAPRIAQAGC